MWMVVLKSSWWYSSNLSHTCALLPEMKHGNGHTCLEIHNWIGTFKKHVLPCKAVLTCAAKAKKMQKSQCGSLFLYRTVKHALPDFNLARTHTTPHIQLTRYEMYSINETINSFRTLKKTYKWRIQERFILINLQYKIPSGSIHLNCE